MTTPDQANYQIPEWEDRKDSKKPRLSKKARLVGGAVAGLVGAGAALGIGVANGGGDDEPSPNNTPTATASPNPSESPTPQETISPRVPEIELINELESMSYDEFAKQSPEDRAVWCYDINRDLPEELNNHWFAVTGNPNDKFYDIPASDKNPNPQEIVNNEQAFARGAYIEHYYEEDGGNTKTEFDREKTRKAGNCTSFEGTSERANKQDAYVAGLFDSGDTGATSGQFAKNGSYPALEVVKSGDSYTENGYIKHGIEVTNPTTGSSAKLTYVRVEFTYDGEPHAMYMVE